MKSPQDLVAAARARIQEIPLEAADEAIAEADILIDVREADEYAAGHIPGAVLIPRGILEFKLGNAPEYAARDLRIVLYCKTSGRAALAAGTLLDMGYLHVQSLAGGFDAWAIAGKRVIMPSLPAFG